MRALNTIVFSAGEPFKRYATAVNFSIAGFRLNPHDLKDRQTFILGDREQNKPFNYEDHVIELYSEIEDKFFIQTNRYLFAQGMLQVYNDRLEDVSMENVLTEEQVTEVASINNINALLAKLAEFSSPVTINRILDRAETIGRPKRFITTIKSYAEGMK